MSSSSSGNNVHLNPRFARRQQQVSHPMLSSPATSLPAASAGMVHINPRFTQSQSQFSGARCSSGSVVNSRPAAPKVLLNPNFRQQAPPAVHLNPNFDSSNRAHVNPQFLSSSEKERQFDAIVKAKTLRAAAKQQQSSSMHINPLFYEQKTASARPVSMQPVMAVVHHTAGGTDTPNKENISSGLRRGVMRIIRKRKSGGCAAGGQAESPIYKKIGSKKLIRVGRASAGAKNSPRTPLAKVHKRTSFVKTPLSTKKFLHKLVTPLGLRKQRSKIYRSPKTHQASANPYKVDNRPTPPPVSTIPKRRPVPKTPSQAPPKPARRSLVAKSQVIHIEGVKFEVSEQGRQLRRVDPLPAAKPCQEKPSALANERGAPIRCSVSRKLFVDGEEFVENDSGLLIRSRNSMTRASITSARNRSIHTLIKSQTRSKQYCMFYNKFGKCNKREKGVCPYIHDPAKVAVCRKFLMGSCLNEKCLLSHKVAPEKMPSCKFFLEGLCTKGEQCPYRHVKVNANAEICQDFLRGHCETGSDCKKRHIMLCPVYEQKGFCPKGSRCPWPHIQHGASKSKASVAAIGAKKKSAPVKPKRKSLSKADTAPANARQAIVHRRYYQRDQKDEEPQEPVEQGEQNETPDPAVEQKRQRLLAKVELAKQGWTGVLVPSQAKETTKSDEAPVSNTPRPSLGSLPQFIPLSKDSSDEEASEDRSPRNSLANVNQTSSRASKVRGIGNDNSDKEKEGEIHERLI